MTIIEEIRERFASMISTNGAIKIKSLEIQYEAYVIHSFSEYGVAIPISEDVIVSEKFNSCKFKTSFISINNKTSNYLILSSSFEEYRYEFASLCAEFVDPGDNGSARKSLLKNPLDWWKKWKELLGNNNKEKAIYNVIAEMCVLEKKFTEDPSSKWTGANMNSHDIECETESCEVKSTCRKYGAVIDIAGQHQLLHQKPLYLYFVRMEESLEGVSVNEMQKRLINIGYDAGKLERELQQLGFELGESIRDKKYKILEKRKYIVDSSFPSITRESFKNNQIPSGIVHVIYGVDLDAVNYTTW